MTEVGDVQMWKDGKERVWDGFRWLPVERAARTVEGNTAPIEKARRGFLGLGHAADAARYAFEGLSRMRIEHSPVELKAGDMIQFTTNITTGESAITNTPATPIRRDDPHQGQPTMRAGGCKICGDPGDHLGDPHPGRTRPDGTDTRLGGRRPGLGVRGPSPTHMIMDEIADWAPEPPRVPLMDPTLSAVLKRRPCKLEVHSDDADWLEDQLLNHRIPGSAVTPSLMDGELGPDSATVEVTELVEPGTVRATYWTPVRNVFTLEHETEHVDVVIR